MTYKLTILGSGAAPGVPSIAGGWGACDPANEKTAAAARPPVWNTAIRGF